MKLAIFQAFPQYYAYEETYWRAMETNYSEKSLNLTLASSAHQLSLVMKMADELDYFSI